MQISNGLSFQRYALNRRSSSASIDPSFNNVGLLLHFDGANNSTTFTDSSPRVKTITPVGSAKISTTQSKFGGASGFFDLAGYCTTPANADFNFGTGDFTVEGWVYFNDTTDMGLFGNTGIGGFDFAFAGNQMRLGRINTAWDTSFNFTRSIGQWYHVAWSRVSGTLYMFVDGLSIGSAANNISYNSDTTIVIGGSTSSDRRFNGYVDDFRVTKSVGRYTTAFTPPVQSFPNQ